MYLYGPKLTTSSIFVAKLKFNSNDIAMVSYLIITSSCLSDTASNKPNVYFVEILIVCIVCSVTIVSVK